MNKLCIFFTFVIFNNVLGQREGNDEGGQIDDRGGSGKQFFPNQLPNQFNPSQIVSGSNLVPGNQFPDFGQVTTNPLPGGQFPGGQFPGGQFPGSQLPGGQFPGGQFPGSQWPGIQIPSLGPDQLNIQNVWQRPTGQRTTQATPTSTPAVSSAPSTQSPETRQCLNSCPVTSEYNPVCGTDNVTYDNPGRLSCAQSCGINVALFRTSRCSVPVN